MTSQYVSVWRGTGWTNVLLKGLTECVCYLSLNPLTCRLLFLFPSRFSCFAFESFQRLSSGLVTVCYWSSWWVLAELLVLWHYGCRWTRLIAVTRVKAWTQHFMLDWFIIERLSREQTLACCLDPARTWPSTSTMGPPLWCHHWLKLGKSDIISFHLGVARALKSNIRKYHYQRKKYWNFAFMKNSYKFSSHSNDFVKFPGVT